MRKTSFILKNRKNPFFRNHSNLEKKGNLDRCNLFSFRLQIRLRLSDDRFNEYITASEKAFSNVGSLR